MVKVSEMQTLNIRDMRNALGHLETLVNASGELIITRHGEAIARVLPIQGLSTSSEKILRDMRDER